jgi:hypothetical protein
MFFFIQFVPLRNPRTECAIQPEAFISSFSEAPSGRFSKTKTLAAFLPSWVLAAGLPCLAAFWLLGRRSAEVAFFPDLGLPRGTRRLCGATLASWVAFGSCIMAAAGWLACSSAFCHRQSPGTAKCRIQDIHPSDVARRQATSVDQSPQILVASTSIIPYHLTR